MYTCMWTKGSAAMLAVKRSAGVTPELNPRNTLQAGEEVLNQRTPLPPTLALKPRADVTRSLKQGIRGLTKRSLQFCLIINVLKVAKVHLLPRTSCFKSTVIMLRAKKPVICDQSHLLRRAHVTKTEFIINGVFHAAWNFYSRSVHKGPTQQ